VSIAALSPALRGWSKISSIKRTHKAGKYSAANSFNLRHAKSSLNKLLIARIIKNNTFLLFHKCVILIDDILTTIRLKIILGIQWLSLKRMPIVIKIY